MNALVIDDSGAMRAMLRKILQQLGYQVSDAANGRLGLETLKRGGPPSVVLVDWNMPEMNGLDFIRAVRADKQYRALPIMMVTSETEMSQVVRGLAAGANEYVMKPFTKEVIEEKLAILGVSPG
jgi:two-component system chemotaxis response regulator CheY